MEGKLPQYNTRVKLPTSDRLAVYDGKVTQCKRVYFQKEEAVVKKGKCFKNRLLVLLLLLLVHKSHILDGYIKLWAPAKPGYF